MFSDILNKFNSIEKWKNSFLLLFFFAIPFSIAAGELATFGLYVTTLLLLWKKRLRWRNVPILYGWGCFFLGVVLSTIYSEEVTTSLGYYRYFWRFALPFVIYFNLADQKIDRYIKVLCVPAVLISLYSTVQFFTGLDVLRPPSQQAEYEQYIGSTWQAVGAFSHHLTLGGVLLLIFPIFLSPLFSKGFSFSEKWVYGLASAVIYTASFLTFGRSIWLGGILALGVLLFFWKPKFTLLVGCLGILGLGGILWQWDGEVDESKENALAYRITSGLSMTKNQDRLNMWTVGWKSVQKNPWFGVGPGMNHKLQPHYDQVAKEKNHTFQHSAETGVHNIYLQTWINFGGVGFLGYLLWWGGIFYAGGKLWRKKESKDSREYAYVLGILAGFSGLLLAGFFENNFRDGEVQITVFVLMGTLLALVKQKN